MMLTRRSSAHCLLVVIFLGLAGVDRAEEPGVSGTFSIVACDPESGICGAAVASKYPAVGQVVPYVRAGVGAVCTQHWHRPEWGPKALDLLAEGKSPEEVLAELSISSMQDTRTARFVGCHRFVAASAAVALWVCCAFCIPTSAFADHALAAPGVTSLTNSSVRFHATENHYVVLERDDIRAILVDNAELDLPELPGHCAGYNGIASLAHRRRDANLFVPGIAGLNFEHIYDGTAAGLEEKFEPRKSPMELRVIDRYTAEVYQPPTANWKLESCGRYHLLEDGTIEYTFECIPRAGGYRNGTIGLFWASYIHRPESGVIFFRGHGREETGPGRWIEAISPAHGVDSTHGPASIPLLPQIDADFPLTLVNHPSKYVYTEPWYFGVSHGMAYVLMFRERDRIWLAQSPSGGGADNPAWDFQWFIPNCQVGEAYGFVMRAAYVPYESREQVERDTRMHREALNRYPEATPGKR